jgi:adenylate kinase
MDHRPPGAADAQGRPAGLKAPRAEQWGADANIFHRPAVADCCDVCGGRLTTRADDTPQAVRERLADYHTKTEPILDLFRTKELVVVVDGTQPPAGVQQEIRAKLAAVAARA